MAATGGAIRAGRAYVEFFADDSKFVRSLRSMDREFRAFGSRLTKIGASIAGVFFAVSAAITPVVASFAKLGDQIAKTTQRTNASTESLTALQYAAEQSGASLDDVTSAMGNVDSKLADIALGNYEAAITFAKLGLNIQKIARLKPEDRFVAIADRLSQIRQPAIRAAAATEIFGGAAHALLPMIAGGAKGIAAMTQRARELGIIMDSQTASAGEKLTRAMHDVTSSVRGLMMQIASALTPSMIDTRKKIVGLITGLTKWVSQNKQVIVMVTKLTVGALALGGAIAAVGAAFIAIGSTLGAIATASAGFAAALSGVLVVVSALLSPVGLLVAGIASVAVAFLRFTKVGRSIADAVLSPLRKLVSEIGSAGSSIAESLFAGDFESAANIAMSLIRLEWAKTAEFFGNIWRGVTEKIMAVWDTAVYYVKVVTITAFTAIQSAWVTTSTAIKNAWDETVTYLRNAWQSSGIQDGFDLLASLWVETTSYISEVWVSTTATLASTWNDFTTAVSLIWNEVVSRLSEAWFNFVDNLTQVMAPVIAAAQSIWDGMLQVWQSMCDEMKIAWAVLFSAVVPVLTQFMNTFAAITGFIEDHWSGTIAFLSDVWKSFTDGMLTDFRGAQSYVAKAITILMSKIRGVDPTQALNEIDAQLARDRANDAKQNAARTAEKDQRVQARNQQAAATQQALKAAQSSGLATAATTLKSNVEGRATANSAASTGASDAVAEARFQLERNMKTAALKRKNAIDDARKGKVATAGKGPSQSFDFSGVGKSVTAGTFSAAAAARLGGSDPGLEQQRQQTRYLSQIATEIRNSNRLG